MAHTNQGCQGLGLKCSDEPQLVLKGQASHRCSRLLHLPLGHCCLLSHLHGPYISARCNILETSL